ncbi:hypothetical protein IFM89_039439 [Coptis chinensis]|uniref:Peptidase C14 caspase domain-containing protein n=1 Tax=Coptis chinensis TaxID=261450 RepID=A0A835I708_9MAGN|nr:hypothetical protein IFM89_039439 [Coptis chinensis]
MGKKAILVGCNYPGTQAELNDVKNMYHCLIQQYGFKQEDMFVIIDTDSSYPQPTRINILTALSIFCQSAEPGDYLFFHFSSHGTRLPANPDSNDNTGYDECIIVPCDMNIITDDDFREFVDILPHGCRITIVSDSCHSGGLIDDAKEQIGESTKREKRDVRLRDFLRMKVSNSFEKCGIHLPLEKLSRRRHHNVAKEAEVQDDTGDHRIIKRSLSLLRLIEILKQKIGKDDITVKNLKLALFDIFGEDTSRMKLSQKKRKTCGKQKS